MDYKSQDSECFETSTKEAQVYKPSAIETPTKQSCTEMQKSDHLSYTKSGMSKWMLELIMPGAPEKEGHKAAAGSTSIVDSIKENFVSLIKEKDLELAQLRQMMADKDSQIKSLQLSSESLNSQLADREKQIELIQQASELKDQQIGILQQVNDELLSKLMVYNNSGVYGEQTIQQQLEAQSQQIALPANEVKSKQWKVKSDTLHITCCPPDSRPDRYDDEQTSNDVAAQPNMEVANKMSQASHMELTSVHTQQLSDTRNLLKAKEEALEEAAATIDNLKMELANQIRLYQTQTEELKYLTIQLLDVDMEKLQDTISEKDKAIAVLEMQSLSPQCYLTGQRSPTEVLHCERQKLMQELKNKVQKKIKLQTKESEADMCHLIENDHLLNEHQVSRAIRDLEKAKRRVKKYIDQLLAIVLDNDPTMLEGMPRVQQNCGMSPDLLGIASLPELMDELKEEEENMHTLQKYAALLLERIAEHSPKLLNSLDIPSDNV